LWRLICVLIIRQDVDNLKLVALTRVEDMDVVLGREQRAAMTEDTAVHMEAHATWPTLAVSVDL